MPCVLSVVGVWNQVGIAVLTGHTSLSAFAVTESALITALVTICTLFSLLTFLD